MKAQYNRAVSQDEKDVLRNQMKVIDLKFLEERKFKENYKFFYFEDQESAISKLMDTIEINIQIIKEYSKWSLSDLNKAIELAQDSNIYRQRGVVYNDLEQYEESLQDFNKAIEFDPNYADAYFWRGYCYFKLGDLKKWNADIDKSKALFDKS